MLAAVELPIYSVPRRFYGIWIYIGGRSTSGEPRGAHEGGGRAPLPRAFLVAFLTCTPSLPGCFLSKNNFSRRFHSVSTPFDIPFLRNTETREKTGTGTGL